MINTNNTFNEAQYANLKSSLPAADYEEFISFKKREKEMDEYKAQQRRDQRKKDVGQDYYNRKDTLILREVRKQDREHEFVTDDKVFAFCDIHKMKKACEEEKGTYKKGDKIEVSDSEISAFIVLEEEGRFYKDITLEMIEAKIAPPKSTKDDTAKQEDAESEDTGADGEQAAGSEEGVTKDESSDESETEGGVAEEKVPAEA